MPTLIAGLALFIFVHLIPALFPRFRTAGIARIGPAGWQGLYSVLSLVGLILVGRGYSEAYGAGELLYDPPAWGRYVVWAAMLVGFILAIASGGPANHIRRFVGDPLLYATALWAGAHLLVRSDTVHVILFGAFLAWAATDLVSSYRRRARGESTAPSYVDVADPPSAVATGVAVVGGAVLWLIFFVFVHQWLFGVSPVG